jgi:WD40 repeat protein
LCRQDDFYLNLVDWSSTNFLGVGLGSSVYLWNATTSKVTKLCDLGGYDTVSSVNWIQRVSAACPKPASVAKENKQEGADFFFPLLQPNMMPN